MHNVYTTLSLKNLFYSQFLRNFATENYNVDKW